MNSTKFTIQKSTITVSENLNKYNSLRRRYKSLADSISKDFNENYSTLFLDMDEISMKMPEIAYAYLEKAIDIAIRDLIDFKITDISDEAFINKYIYPTMSWNEDYFYIEDQYLKIVMSADEYERARRSRTPTGGIIGGGFGLEGAIQGIAVATAANLAIKLLSNMAAAIGTASKNIGTEKEKQKLFSNPSTRENLTLAINKLIFNVHLAVIDAITDIKKYSPFEIISIDRIERANAILNNISKKRIPKGEIIENLVEAIKSNPYHESAYEELLLRVSGEAETEVLKMCRHFDIAINTPQKNKNTIKNTNSGLATENIAQSNTTDEARTFDGNLFDTKNEADLARIQYFKKFIETGRSLDSANKIEIGKITNQNNILQGLNNITLIGALASILMIIFWSPWWHGALSIALLLITTGYAEKYIKRKAIILWLESKKNCS